MSDDEIARMKKQLLEELREELLSGARKRPMEDNPTLRQLWQEWEDAAPDRKDWKMVRSIRRRILDVEIAVNGFKGKFGELPFDRCDHAAAKAWRVQRKKQITNRGKAPVPATRDREMAALMGMLSYHKEEERITVHPLLGLGNEGKPTRRKGYYTDAQLEDVLRHAHPLLGKMMRLSFYCGGLRRTEVRLLRESEVEWDHGFIVLPPERTKNGQEKRIPLTQDMYDMLAAQRDALPRTIGDRYLFPNPQDPRGGPVREGTMHAWMMKARDKSGVMIFGQKPTFHHLRHSWAVHTLHKGAPVPWVMDAGGWESFKVAQGYMRLEGGKEEAMREFMSKPNEEVKTTLITKPLRGERRSPHSLAPLPLKIVDDKPDSDK